MARKVKVIDGVEHFLCKYCDEWQPKENFRTNSSPNGRDPYCIPCRKEYQRNYYAGHRIKKVKKEEPKNYGRTKLTTDNNLSIKKKPRRLIAAGKRGIKRSRRESIFLEELRKRSMLLQYEEVANEKGEVIGRGASVLNKIIEVDYSKFPKGEEVAMTLTNTEQQNILDEVDKDDLAYLIFGEAVFGNGENYSNFKEYKMKKYAYKAYKNNAIAGNRNYEFNLTFEEFITFWQQPCYYCGREIETIGVDRIINTSGYFMENCVPCCTACNCGKSNMSFTDYINRTNLILTHQLNKKNNNFNAFKDYTHFKRKTDRFRNPSTSRKKLASMQHTVTNAKLRELWQEPCAYCGESIKYIGLDRKNSDIGYTDDNVIPCCRKCNTMKWTDSLREFGSRLKSIQRKFK